MRHRFPLLAVGLIVAVGLAAAALRPPHLAPVARTATPAVTRPAPSAVENAPVATIVAPVPHRTAGSVAAVRGSSAAAPAARSAHAGMIVAVDPETGQLGMPSAEQREQLLGTTDEELLSRSMEGLVVEHHPNGAVSVDLQGRFQEYAVVRVGPDGKLVFNCVDDLEGRKKALDPHAPMTPKAEEK